MKVLTPKKDQRVVAGFPSRFERSARFMDDFVRLQAYDAATNRRILDGGGVIPLPATIIATARNQICRAFLDEHTADWLWFIDTDMTFQPDIVDRLVQSAHPRERPIMGALCFSITDDCRALPTVYAVKNGQPGRVLDYPRNTVFQALTGTGCLLIHRTVLEAMRAKYRKPWEWFAYGTAGEDVVGEDITFCVRANEAGFPVHVDTAIKCGHEKPVIVDEAMFLAQRLAGVA